jgi:hypothetical protein
MDEDERVKRQNFIQHLREREQRKERYEMNEDEKRERRMADYDRQVAEREHADREQGENDAAQSWLVQRQCVEDIRRSESPRTTSAAAVAEPQLEVFDYKWVQRHVVARLREERAYYEARLTELSDAVAENARVIADAFDAVDRALAKAGAKANKEIAGALQRISDMMATNQHQIMRAINNKIADEHSKPTDQTKNAPAKIH